MDAIPLRHTPAPLRRVVTVEPLLEADHVATAFLTVDEAAAYLGLSVKTVLRAYRGEGAHRAHPLPGYKPSRRGCASRRLTSMPGCGRQLHPVFPGPTSGLAYNEHDSQREPGSRAGVASPSNHSMAKAGSLRAASMRWAYTFGSTAGSCPSRSATVRTGTPSASSHEACA